MFKKIITRIVIWSLSTAKLDNENKAKITGALLENLNAIPIRDIIKFDATGKLMINGNYVDFDIAEKLRAGSFAMQNNAANKLVDDQMTFEALKLCAHKGESTDMIVFAKAALWIIQERKKLFTTLGGE